VNGTPRLVPALAGFALAFSAGCADPGAEGHRASAEGRFEDAHAAYASAVARAGDVAPAELLVDRALAALRAGSLREVEPALELAAACGDRRVRERCEFLRGNLAFARAELAEW
jgi:hypothetical protein